MKKGLVLEGGAMRGVYTAGVLDVFLDNKITFDGIVGVSAGALFGVNFLSKQRGRAIRYSKKFNGDKNYMGILPLIKDGNVINTEYAYHTVPRELDVFDNEAYKKSNIPFFAVMTNIETAKAEYIQITNVFDQMDMLRASGSMPFLSKPVEINGKLYLDGAVTDSIPYDFMKNQGYDDILVILTKPSGYRKKAKPSWITDIKYKKKYPKFAKTLNNRYKMYNNQMEKLEDLENKNQIKVIRPSKSLNISRTEKDPQKLEAQYQLGIKDARDFLEEEKIIGG